MSETLIRDSIQSPLGELAFALSEQGVVAITFLSEAKRGTLEDELPGKPRLVRDPKKTKLLKAELNAYFAGDLQVFESVPDMRGTTFQVSVWEQLLRIPYGGTATYGAVARHLGRPSASRAVGMANNKNRIGILVPCHRVIGGTGALVGYAGGLDRKKFLLDLECRVAMRGGPLSC